MPTRVQLIRAATSQADVFTGLEGEITVDTTKNTLRVHDGSTAGGHEVGKADASNIQSATNAQDGKATAAQITSLETAQSNISDLQNGNEGLLEKSLEAATGTVTLTDAEAKFTNISFTGSPGEADVLIRTPASFPLKAYNITNRTNQRIRFAYQNSGTITNIRTLRPKQIFPQTSAGIYGAVEAGVDIDYVSGGSLPGSPDNVGIAIRDVYADLNTRDLASMKQSQNLDDVSNKKTSRDNLSVALGQIGMVMAWPSNTPPAEWEVLDGSTIGSAASAASLSSNSYQTLFEFLWNNCPDAACPVSGGRGGSANADWTANKTLGLPDLRGKSILGGNNASLPNGVDGGLTTRAVGDNGGSETHTLTEGELPAHTHSDGTLATDTLGAHQHTFAVAQGGSGGGQIGIDSATFLSDRQLAPSLTNANYMGSAGDHSHDVTGATGSTGSGTAHNNMQPFWTMNHIIFSGVA